MKLQEVLNALMFPEGHELTTPEKLLDMECSFEVIDLEVDSFFTTDLSISYCFLSARDEIIVQIQRNRPS